MEENQDLLTIIHKVTANQVVKYAESSGDLNPIHLDSAYATTTQFGKRIAHGMLIISFVSDFMYKNFREKWLNSGGLKIRFKSPVFLNDVITTNGTIKNTEKSSEYDKITCFVTCTKQDGSNVISGIAFC